MSQSIPALYITLVMICTFEFSNTNVTMFFLHCVQPNEMRIFLFPLTISSKSNNRNKKDLNRSSTQKVYSTGLLTTEGLLNTCITSFFISRIVNAMCY